jgi:hypothetical protein
MYKLFFEMAYVYWSKKINRFLTCPYLPPQKITSRDLATAFTLFAMRLELARARALEGFRVGDEEGPDAGEALGTVYGGGKYRPTAAVMEGVGQAGECYDCSFL